MPGNFKRTEQRTARKRYRCSVCSVAILPGDLHWYRVGRQKREFGQIRLCEKCAARFAVEKGDNNAVDA